MAQSKSTRGVLQFVEKKNDIAGPQAQKHAQLKALKFHERPSTPSAGAHRTDAHMKTRSMSNLRSREEPEINLNNAFGGTDLGSFDRAASTDSLKRSHSSRDQRPISELKHDDAKGDANLELASDEEFVWEEQSDGEGPPDDPMHAHFEGAWEQSDQAKTPVAVKNETVDPQNGNMPGLRRISGDTYPETTSGRPSESDALENREPRYIVQTQTHGEPYVSGNLPTRGGGTRTQFGKPTSQTGQAGQLPNVPVKLSGEASNVMAEFNSGFSFAPANKPSFATARPQAHRQPKDHQTAVQKFAVPDVTQQQQPHAAPQGQQQPRVRQLAREGTPGIGISNEPNARQFNTAVHRPKSRNGTPIPQQGVPRQLPQPKSNYQTSQTEQGAVVEKSHTRYRNAPQEARQHEQTYSERREYYPQFSQPPREEELVMETELEPEKNLDYEPPELFKMPFEALRQQDFDQDPNAEAFRFLGKHNEETLCSKMQAVQTLLEDDRARFLGSLTMDQWEEAGDWFLEQFGEIAKRLKATRREKRKVAHEFEEKINVRHEDVAKKRQLTEAALGEMRESGGRVLQGTPKKTKKST